MSPVAVTPASFIGKNRSEVAKRLLERMPRVSDMTYVGEGSIIRAFMESVAAELGNAYAIVSLSWTQQLVTQASGGSLDSLGALYGISRRQVSYESSYSSFYFYLASSSTHQLGIPNTTADTLFTIPEGTLVQTSDDVVGDTYAFETTAAVTFEEGDSIHYVTLSPVTSDIAINVAANMLRVHDYDGTGYEQLYCVNPIEINTNTEVESDDDYRVRIIQAVRNLACATNVAIRLAALSVDHVRDAKIVERYYGPGTALVIIVLDSLGSNTHFQEVRTAIDDVRPAGSLLTLVEAAEIPVDITYAYSTTTGDALGIVQRAIESAATSYINSLSIGQTFSRGMLVQRMFQAAPTAEDIRVTSIKIDGRNFIGDSYKVDETSVLVMGTITQAA